MAKFNLTAEVTISIYTEVEATDLDEAIAIAESREIERYHWGDKTQHESVWVSQEYDGIPQNIQAE